MRIALVQRIALITVMTAAATSARAAVYTWDTAPGAVGVGDSAITGGGGTWDTTNGNWTTDGGANNVAWPGAGSDNDAIFGGTAGTVSIAAGGVTANDVTLNSAYTIQSNSLTLNGTTPTITLNNVSATINSSLVLSSDANITVAGVTGFRLLTLGGGLTGTNRNLAVSVTGAGSGAFSGVQINANGSYSGTLSVTNNAASGQAQLGITAAVAQNALIDTDVTVNGTYFQLGNGNAGKLVQVRSLAGNNVSNNVSSDNQANTLVIGTNNNTLGSTTYSGNLTNGGGGGAHLSLIKNGTATQVLAGTNTYTGSTQINGGILRLSNLSSASALSFTNNAALEISATMTLGNNVTIAGGQSGRIRMTGATNTTLTGNYTAMAGTLTLDLSNAASFSWFGIASANGPALGSTVNVIGSAANTGQIILNNSLYQNFFANTKLVLPTSGTAYFGGGNGSANINLAFGALDGGVLASNAGTYTGTVIGVDNTAGTVTITGVADGDFAGKIFDGNGTFGAVNVVKNGAGTQVFSGANQYSGGTVVNGGELLVANTTGSGSGTGSVTVNGGILGGSGIISGAVTVNAGGKLSPGNSPGTLTINNLVNVSAAVAAANTQSMHFELGSTSDLIDMTNGTAILSIGSGVLEFDDFVFTAVTGFGEGTYTLFATDQLINGSLGSNLTGTISGYNAMLALAGGGTDLVLNVTAIPAPAALPAGLALLALAAMRRRR